MAVAEDRVSRGSAGVPDPMPPALINKTRGRAR